LRLSKQWR